MSSHPTPLAERALWHSIDGLWEFAFDDQARWRTPDDVVFDRSIQVPYPPESESSGIQDTSYHPVLWYRTVIDLGGLPSEFSTSELLPLHFGAVDYRAKVWANGVLVAEHEGGHTPFSAELSGAVRATVGDLRPDGQIVIVVRAEDDPHDLAQPRGKQDWELTPHEIWYPRTSGIWQTVWLEPRPRTHLSSILWTSNVERWEVAFRLRLNGRTSPQTRLRITLSMDGTVLAQDEYAALHAEINRTIGLKDAGTEDVRRGLLWSPDHPQLIEAVFELYEDGQIIDRVKSYTALRSVAVDEQHFLLNGRPYHLKMVLDQGYWPESLMSATDQQLRRDVELTRLLGFNGARKHQKIENPRYLYWCDVIGLLVWEELPSAYVFSGESAQRLTREWMEVIARDQSHPCIVAWVPFNESWGVPDLPQVSAQRELVRALYSLTKALDPTRPVIGNDGWEHVVTDIVGIHDYTHQPARLTERYGSTAALKTTLEDLRPANRLLTLPEFAAVRKPVLLSEFGGIAYTPDQVQGWGYHRTADAQALEAEYTSLMTAVHRCTGLMGYCYTQLTDTFQEKNGLLYEDRTPKVALPVVFAANLGDRSGFELDADPVPDPMGYHKRWRRKRREQEASVTLS
ncbi:glycoside hydrolase family 2 protein [Deinococcus sp.]|uniref:glycoside hydrolase family 2 protein n=1 Tax=Deinococcus sp. TaxID=47478 RepID=UPI003C79937E